MPDSNEAKRVLVLGASGGVGREIIALGLDRGLDLTAQTRRASKLQEIADRVRVVETDPRDSVRITEIVSGQDAVIFSLGVDQTGQTTLFSDATRILIEAMQQTRVRRLVAITGVGAGETRGHGGFLYDWFIFPLFTRKRYLDKDRQEALIEKSALDWTIVRPAPFNERPASTPFQVHTGVAKDVILRRVTRREVAGFVLDQLGSDQYLRQKPFIGHPW